MCGNQYENYCNLKKSEEQKRTSLEAEDYTTVQEEVTVDSHTAASQVLVKLCLLDIGVKWAFFRRIVAIFVGELHPRGDNIWYFCLKERPCDWEISQKKRKHWEMMLLWINCKLGVGCVHSAPPQGGLTSGFPACSCPAVTFHRYSGSAGWSWAPCHSRVVTGRTKSLCSSHTLRVITVEHLPHYTQPACVLGRSGGAFYCNLASVPDSAAEFFTIWRKPGCPPSPKRCWIPRWTFSQIVPTENTFRLLYIYWSQELPRPVQISLMPVVFLLIYSKLSAMGIGSELWGSRTMPFATPSHWGRRLDSKCSYAHSKGTSSKKKYSYIPKSWLSLSLMHLQPIEFDRKPFPGSI